MKQNKSVRIFLLLVFLFPLKLFAQQDIDITGVWKGQLFDDTTSQYIPYEIAISENNGKLSGYSYAVFKGDSVDEIGVKTLKIWKKADKIIIQDVDLISNNYSIAPPKRLKKLIEATLTIKDSIMTIAGKWRTNWIKGYHPVTGSIEIKRKNDQWKDDPLIKKLDDMKLTANLSFIPKEPNEQSLALNNTTSSSQTKKDIDSKKQTGATNTNNVSSQSASIKDSINNAKAIAKQQEAKVKDSINNARAVAKQLEAKAKDSINNAKAIAKQQEAKVKDSVNNAKAIAKQLEAAAKDSINKANAAAKQLAKKEKNVEGVATQELAAKRKTAVKRSIYFHTDSLVITLYDNGVVDGDTVSVLMNGSLIFSKAGLSDKPITKTIYMDGLPDSIALVMFAENLGSIPPNTGLMIIYDGKNRNEIFYSADLQNNDAIVLRRRKEN